MSTRFQDDEIVGKAYDSRLMRRLLTFLSPYRFHVIAAVLLLIAGAAAELVGPYLVKIAIDTHIQNGDINGLRWIAGFYIGTLVLSFGLHYGQTYLTQWIGQHIMYDIRMRIFSHLQRLPLSFFDRNPVGRLVTRSTNDVETLNNMLSSGVVAIFGDIFLLFGIVFVMLQLSWSLALVTFIVLPFIFYAAFLFRRKVRDSYRQIRARIAKINTYLQENITGMAVVQIFNRETRNARHFDHLNRDHLEAYLKTIKYYAIFFPIVEVISAVSLALILWYGGIQILDETLTIGVVVAFIQYAQRFFHPIRDLSEKYNIMQGAMASSERIFKLLDEPKQKLTPENKIDLPTAKGDIRFEDISFAYNPDDMVLRDISFHVRPAEKVAIVGATGAGKTTIINLLTRMYEPVDGRILLDGRDMSRLDVLDVRSRVRLVSQNVFIFSGTVEYNIRLGDKSISMDRVIKAAKEVNAHSFIMDLPHGYQTELREGGSNLSVGQKQLISFARALAFDPEILVLDEATSSVDTETEELITRAIGKLMAHRTSLIIAHRLSTIKSVDWIIVLHKGKIREVGRHHELLAQKGIYHRLYQLQYEQQIKPAESA